MEIYHGSNMVVDVPRILQSHRRLDFGRGFYCTSGREQAEKWAKSVLHRRGGQAAILNIYELNISEKLEILKFDAPDDAWLDYVVANRRGIQVPEKVDLVIGPVANDSTLEVINDYMNGRFPKAIAIQLLLPQKLKDQYVFRTKKALQSLRFVEREVL